MRRFLVLAIAAIVLGVGTPSARAVLLSDLITSGGTITNGDKVFSGFDYLTTGNMPLATAVNVVAYTDPTTGNLGIQIQGGFFDSPFDDHSSDASVFYTVTTTGGLITDVHLDGNPVVGGPSGLVSVTETVKGMTPPVNPSPSQLLISSINNNGATSEVLSDSLNLSQGYTSLRIEKNILAFGTGLAMPQISIINQTFSQAAIPPVPEPTTLAGAGIAVFFSLAYAWRRHRAKVA